MIAISIKVKDANGAYTTNTINRQRASSTSSAEEAARRLADKLFGAAVQRVEPAEQKPGDPRNVTWWRITVAEVASSLAQ